jgi:hypothetical protein
MITKILNADESERGQEPVQEQFGDWSQGPEQKLSSQHRRWCGQVALPDTGRDRDSSDK